MKTTDQLKNDLVRAIEKWARLYEARFMKALRKSLPKRLGK